MFLYLFLSGVWHSIKSEVEGGCFFLQK